MVANIHYRWDFIGLSTDTKPTPETSEKVVDGSTYYTSDDSKLYIWYKDQWYEKEVTGGGGGGSYTAGDGIVIANDEISVDLAQTTGASTTSVMSQKAVTDALAGAGGGAKELTSADYDYPDANPNGVALWRKDAGMYYWKQGVNVYISTTQLDSSEESAVVFKTDAYYLDILTIYPGGDKNTYTWYKVTASTGVGAAIGSNTYNHILSGANVAASTGTSTTDVMNQNATTSMVFADPSNSRQVKIGAKTSIYQIADGAVAIGYRTEGRGGDFVSIGSHAKCSQNFCVAVGSKAVTNDGISGAVALGYGAQATREGEVNIGATHGYGYNSTNYRVLGGVHDGQTAHDAVTVEQVNATIDAINTALSTSIPHIGATS